jgi:large subunit ribosomal protein L13
MIVDATDAILGRLATRIAKELLKGENIIVINAEKAVISGNPEAGTTRFYIKRKRGDPKKGPFYPKYPDGILKRTVRGMLPYKKDKGKKAFRRLKVYMGNPDDLKGEKISKTSEDLKCKYTTLKDLCKKLGAKID